ncbi:MAG TPA: histidine kinase dimerization/phosphoacceptor domain -containing protein [Coleofasciculaceae cyanobacterium]|jgi:PAS domain S-box-containing protein
MNLDNLQEQINSMRSRLAERQQQVQCTPSLPQQLEILAIACFEIDTALAQVQVVLRELRPNEQVAAIKSAVEVKSPPQQELFELAIDGDKEAQRKSFEILHTVVTNAPVVLYALDSEGTYTLTEGKGLDSLARKPGQAVGQSIFDLYRNYPDILENIRSCLAGKKHRWLAQVGDVIFSNQTTALRDENGQVIGMIGVATDITEQHRAERALRESEQKFRQLAENIREIFWILDPVTAKILYISPIYEQVWGRSCESLYAEHESFLEAVHPEDQAFVRSTLRQKGHEEGVDIEYRIVRPCGEVRWIHDRCFPVHDEAGKVYRFVGFAEDITERKLAETRIKESLLEKEILLQEIHHRVKNNLQVLSSLFELQSQYIKEQAMQSIFRDCCNRVKSIALVHETLYRAKNFASINFKEYIKNLASYLYQIYTVKLNQIKVELDIDEVVLNINTAIPCGLIINELVSNALKHAFPDKTDGIINVTFSSDLDKHYRLTVKDNGVGFSRNQDLNSVKTLGLQLVKVLSNQLGGTLELDGSTGTEFCLRFPELV